MFRRSHGNHTFTEFPLNSYDIIWQFHALHKLRHLIFIYMHKIFKLWHTYTYTYIYTYISKASGATMYNKTDRMDILFNIEYCTLYIIHITYVVYRLGVFVKLFYSVFCVVRCVCHNCNSDFWLVSSGFLHLVDVRVFQFLRRFILSLIIGAVSLQHGVPIDFHQHRLFQLKSVLTAKKTRKKTQHNNEIHKIVSEKNSNCLFFFFSKTKKKSFCIFFFIFSWFFISFELSSVNYIRVWVYFFVRLVPGKRGLLQSQL